MNARLLPSVVGRRIRSCSHSRRRRRAAVRVEPLETRRLLSVADPVSSTAAPALVSSAVPSAIVQHQVIPIYSAGSARLSSGSPFDRSIGQTAAAIAATVLSESGLLSSAQATSAVSASSIYQVVLTRTGNPSAAVSFQLVIGVDLPLDGRSMGSIASSQSASNVFSFPTSGPVSSSVQGLLSSITTTGSTGAGFGSLGAGGTASGSTGLVTSTVAILVIVVPVGSREVVLVVPVSTVSTTPSQTVSTPAPQPLAPSLTEHGLSFSTLVALARFGQGQFSLLGSHDRLGFDIDGEIPALIDLVEPFQAVAAPLFPEGGNPLGRPRPVSLTEPEATALLPLRELPQEGTSRPVTPLPLPAPVGTEENGPRRDETEEGASSASAVSTLSGVSVLAGLGYWMTLRDMGQRKTMGIVRRPDRSPWEGARNRQRRRRS